MSTGTEGWHFVWLIASLVRCPWHMSMTITISLPRRDGLGSRSPWTMDVVAALHHVLVNDA
eukprot:9846-Eustigmatos_ZCMA.PRE.1